LIIPILEYDRSVTLEPDRVGRRPLDFTSSLYLGMFHPTCALEPWSQLTTGKPSALETAPSSARISEALARLQGCESAILLPSTLHLFFDLFEALRGSGIAIYADAATYKVALWGAERVAARGVILRRFGHYDPAAARVAIAKDDGLGVRPIIVADGFCPECGRPAPLAAYLQCVVPYGGYVVLDDTQALGIWGTRPGSKGPYGSGGGGSLRLHAIRSPHVILGSSLAKGFGVPLAVLSGSERIVELFRRRSETLVHSSPPSIASLHAAAHALGINAQHGDSLRLHLAKLVARFRERVRLIGLRDSDGLFPVRMISPDHETDALSLKRLLRCAGVRTAAVMGRTSAAAKLVFLINVLHSLADIDRATAALADVVQDLH
jgi:8-amino-7-oxononanoate synthase